MFWDLFDRIINAVKPGQQSQQPSDESQSWSEGRTDQDEASQEPSPDWQETATTNQDEQQP